MKGRKKNQTREKRDFPLQFLLTRFRKSIRSSMFFRTFCTALLLHFSFPLFAQNHWDSVLPEKKENTLYLIFGENVNIRKEANTKSTIVAKLNPGDPIKILKKTNSLLSQGSMKEYWYEIQTGDKKGFVWGSLLADSYADLGDNKILIRNPGAHTKKIEFKFLKSGKVISNLTLSPGPVANEDWKYKIYNGSLFTPKLGTILGFRYLVYSEIEYAQLEETLIRIDEKGKMSEFFVWYPGGCDPPSCMESWIVFPGEILGKDTSIGRKEYKGITNSILEITRSYDVDDISINEYSESIRKWNGKSLVDVK